MSHLIPGRHVAAVAPLRQHVKDNAPRTAAEDFNSLEFSPGSILHELPEPMQRRLAHAAATGAPSLLDVYGARPPFHVVAAIRHGPSVLATNLSQNITNKAVISALLLTFNYPALFSAADDDRADRDNPLFVAYFFFQMAAVVCAFAVMLSAAIFVSHVLRTGQQVDSLITYLRKALWVDNAFNEGLFIGQCLFTCLAVILYVWLYYPGVMAKVLSACMCALVLMLVPMLAWSTRIFHATGQREWQELCEAEAEFRKEATSVVSVSAKGAAGGAAMGSVDGSGGGGSGRRPMRQTGSLFEQGQ